MRCEGILEGVVAAALTLFSAVVFLRGGKINRAENNVQRLKYLTYKRVEDIIYMWKGMSRKE